MLGCLASPAWAGFTAQEAAAVRAYWAPAKRHSKAPALRDGAEWRAQITPAGSEYLLRLYKLFGPGKVPPTREPVAPTAELAAWQGWAERRYAHDHAAAAAQAAARNAGGPPPLRPQPTEPAPPGLVEQLGPPPVMVECVRPMRHTVVFHDGARVELNDHVRVRERYPYYRSHGGVAFAGTKASQLGTAKLDSLFATAGLSAAQRRVFLAVSLLEGGFDSVNTYDSGTVSAGFIQFACLKAGSGSLGAALAEAQRRWPKEFQAHFRKFGVGVTRNGELECVEIESGRPLSGAHAGAKIAADPRLAAVFVRAGQRSDAWRAAQVASAHRQFWPADDVVTVRLAGLPYSVRVGDVVRSEAGLATLLDRKVNTGKLNAFVEHAERIAPLYGIVEPADLPAIELPIVRALTYREDYLVHAGLTKPREPDVAAFRQGRRGRGG